MLKIKRLLMAVMLLTSIAAMADTVEGVIITAGDTEQKIALADIREITFSDDAMTVVKTDEASVTFDGAWELRFGEVATSGIALKGADAVEGQATVYDIKGGVVMVLPSLSALRITDLPKGVYIVKCNGMSLKIQR